MNILNFRRLPYKLKVAILSKLPVLRVAELPVGNNQLVTPLKKGEIVLNIREKQSSFPGRDFAKIKHGESKKDVSVFDYGYFEPVK